MINQTNKSLKKLIIFHPSIEGAGVEKNLFIIANYLSKKLDVSVLSADKRNDKFSRAVNLITPFFYVKENAGRPIKYIICLVILIYKLFFNRKNYTVLSFQANIYAIIVCYIFKVKIISRSNSSPSGWSKNKIKQSIFNFFLRRADCIITNSIDFKRELDKKFNVQSKLILNPFDIKKIIKLSKKKIKLNFFKKNHLKLINVARLTDQKDHLTLLKAIKIAIRKRKIQLIIVGRGVFQKTLEKYINENKLESNILMVGYQTNPFKFMRLSDVFVLSSVFEGHPNVLVEAQVLKKYIISYLKKSKNSFLLIKMTPQN
jgi:glycosyltransferase involved in cell wall biosynthesis